MSAPGPNPAQTYEDYFGPAIFMPLSRVVLAAAAPRSGERVLDVACGTGIVTRQLAPRVGPTGTVVGLDISPGMLAVARALPRADGAAIEWREGSGTALGLADATFDAVICQQGLQFFPDRAAGAAEMRRVLVSGGRAVVAVWQGLEQQSFFHDMVAAEARVMKVPIEKVAAPFMFGDAQVLRSTLAGAGFARVEVSEHTIDVRFPMPEKFVRLTIMAAAAVMPEFAGIDVDVVAAEIMAEIAGALQRHRDGEFVRFTMVTNVATAHA